MEDLKAIQERIISDQNFRKQLAKSSLRWFFHIYFPHYIQYRTGDFHKELYGDLEDFNNKFIEIIAFRGSAKRQPLDAKILTPDGFRLMGELSVGDEVIGSDGKSTGISYISEIVKRPVYIVETTDGRKTQCDIEHLWTVRKMSNVREKYITIDTQGLIDAGLYYERIDKRDGKRYKEYKFAIDTVKPVELRKKVLQLDPYLLGLLLGDGSLDKKTGFARLYFHKDDGNHYRRYLSEFDLSETKYKKGNGNAGRFSIRGISNIIKGLGLNVTCHDKFIPDDYLYGSIEQRKALLEGLMDTDGTLNSGTPSFCTVSEKLANGVVSLVRSLGGRAKKIKHISDSFYYWGISILFTDYTPFRLERKKEKHRLSVHPFVTITKIYQEGIKDGRCITIDNQDGLYVTDDYLLTHNSTIAALALPVWSLIAGKAKFPLISSDTFLQVKQHIWNLKTELESNSLLIRDWGPFMGKKEEWTSTEIVIPEYGARIAARSTGQKVRGVRHRENRPDLFIADDLENLESIRTKEQRDKDERWLMGEALPALSTERRVVLIGNLLHSDSLMMRVKGKIERKEMDGIIRMYSFFKDKDETVPYWGEKFDTDEKVEEEKRKYNDKDWQREFLLKIVPEEGQEIKDDWIKKYKKIPEGEPFLQGTGVDLAISKKETADFTSMVSAKLFEIDGAPKIFILPYPVNERMSQHETVQKATAVSKAVGNGTLTSLWVEEVAYQKAAIEEMEREGLPAMGVKVSNDKRARLRMVGVYVQNGTVVFPEGGCEDLLIQLLGFGVEAHDDLVDGFSMVVQALMNDYSGRPKLTIF